VCSSDLYLRSATSLTQTAGRAARHLHGEVILYADVKTQSIQKFLAVSEYRRDKQLAYNREHNITPRSVNRAVEESLASYESRREQAHSVLRDAGMDVDLTTTLQELDEEMLAAANNLEFEKAALLRDQIRELKRGLDGVEPGKPSKAAGYTRQRSQKFARAGRGPAGRR
jgi:excinuclease ABC subunit B